jgi:hypothetical protein
MKTRTFLLPSLALCALLSGCVGTGPNTQQGAVTGGALGALAGAIIGNNSRGGNGLAGALIGGTAGAIAGGTIGNSVDNQQGTVNGASSRPPVYTSYAVQSPPPLPPGTPPGQTIIPAAPSPTALWVPGYWSYDGYQYRWAAGHWEIPPPNAHSYVAAHWENRGSSYAFIEGYWQ